MNPTLITGTPVVRPRGNSRLLCDVHRIGLEVFFFLLLLCSLGNSFLPEDRATKLLVGNSHLYETDVALVLLLAWWSAGLALRPFRYLPRGRLAVYLLLGSLVLPVPTGLAAGKAWSVVMRDVRTPMFYLAVLPMADVLARPRSLRGGWRVLIGVAWFSAAVGAWRWLVASGPSDAGQLRFGVSSANSVVVWVLLVTLARSVVGARRARWNDLAYVLAALLCVFVLNDVRSLYVGTMAGLTVLAVVYLRGRGRLVSPRVLRRIALVMVGLTMVAAAAASSLAVSGHDLRDLVLADMRLRRLYSLIDPTEGGTVVVGNAGTNRDDRLLAVRYGFELGSRHGGFGLGYGDNPFIDLDPFLVDTLIARNALEGNPGNVVENLLLTHNSFGWAFGRLGVWCACLYFACLGSLGKAALRAAKRAGEPEVRGLLLGTVATMVFMLVQGFGGGSFFDYTGQGLVTWLACLAVLVRLTTMARERASEAQ